MKLSEIAEVVRGVTFDRNSTKSEALAGYVPILRAGNIQDELYLHRDLLWIPKGIVSAKQMLRHGDIVMCTSSGSADVVGKTAVFADTQWEGSFGAFCAVVRPDADSCHPEYVKHFLRSKSFLSWAKSSLGANIKNIRKTELENFELRLPEKAEQKRISNILDKADSLRRKRQQAIRLTDDFLHAVFIDMFGTCFVERTGAWHSIGDITAFIDYRGKTPTKSDSGVPLLTAKNVKDGYLDEEPREFIQEDHYLQWMTRGFPQVGDVLFTTEAPLGNVALLPQYEKVALAQRVICMRPSKVVTSEYLLWALRHPKVVEQIDARSTGSTVKGIRSKELVLVEMPIPPIELQRRFSEITKKIGRIKSQQNQHVRDSDALKDSLASSLL